MDTLIKGIADLLLVGGTVGGYAMITIILIIVGYFKYLKPFLSDFYEMKEVIDKFQGSLGNITTSNKDIRMQLERSVDFIGQAQKVFKTDLSRDNREHHTELLNLVKELNKELGHLQSKSEKLEGKSEDNHKELLIEITKLQTRLEYANQGSISGMRGIQK